MRAAIREVAIYSAGRCIRCARAKASADGIPNSGREIADRVVVSGSEGRRYYFFHQCAICGSIWVTYSDPNSGELRYRCLTDVLF